MSKDCKIDIFNYKYLAIHKASTAYLSRFPHITSTHAPYCNTEKVHWTTYTLSYLCVNLPKHFLTPA